MNEIERAIKQLDILKIFDAPELKKSVELAKAALREKLTWEQNEPLTNADRIRSMSDKELARFLAEVENRRSACGGGAEWNGMAHALEWLRQPADAG